MAKKTTKIKQLTVPLPEKRFWELERLVRRQELGVELDVGQLIRERLDGERG